MPNAHLQCKLKYRGHKHPRQVIREQLRAYAPTGSLNRSVFLFLDSVRHRGTELGRWQCTCPVGAYILGCKDLLLIKNSLERGANSAE